MKLFLSALLLVLVCAVPPALADKPPQSLFDRVTTTSQLVHQGTCNVQLLNKRGVECLIFYDAKQDFVWVVLFDQGGKSVTFVILTKGDQEVVAWCRQDVCV